MTEEITDLYELLRSRRRPPQLPATITPLTPPTNSDTAHRYGTGALKSETQRVAQAPEGERNHTLVRAAFRLGQLINQGHLNEVEVHTQLMAAAAQCGLPPTEADKTIRSGLRGGTQNPRDPIELTPQPPEPVIGVLTLTPTTNSQQDDDQDEQQQPARTSWWPNPLPNLTTQAAEQPPPEHLQRTDGKGIFYAGKINGILGASESGKTWLALHAVAQATSFGHKVLIIDFEDTPTTTHNRLTQLGLTPQQLALIDYADPDQILDHQATQDLTEALTNQYALIIVDGVNAAMTLLGLDLNSNTDATTFTVRVLRPMARTGAAVVTIDHLPKSSENRGAGGIGAQAKRAMMDGCAILVTPDQPFGKGQSGSLKLTVDKDRPGYVRGYCANGKTIGKAIIETSHDEMRISITPPPDKETIEEWQGNNIKQQILDLLANHPDGLSKSQIREHPLVTGRKDRIDDTLEDMWADGTITTGKRGRWDVFMPPEPHPAPPRPTPPGADSAQPSPHPAPPRPTP